MRSGLSGLCLLLPLVGSISCGGDQLPGLQIIRMTPQEERKRRLRRMLIDDVRGLRPVERAYFRAGIGVSETRQIGRFFQAAVLGHEFVYFNGIACDFHLRQAFERAMMRVVLYRGGVNFAAYRRVRQDP